MKSLKEYIPTTAQFIENYKGVNIFYSVQNGYGIQGYWNTYRTLSDTKICIDFRLNKDMVATSKGSMMFKELANANKDV